MDAAIATLEISLSVLETNEPINRARGDVDQADLEAESAAQTRKALEILRAASA